MAAFSYQLNPFHFHLDSVFLPIKNLDEPSPNSIAQFYPLEYLPLAEIEPNLTLLDHSDNDVSYETKKQSTDSSSSMDNKLENGDQVTQQLNHSMDNKRKKKNNSNNNSFVSSSTATFKKDDGQGRSKKQKQSRNEGGGKRPKAKKKVGEGEASSGYIHVRARRGQATDSHSLAERVRREKISERMNILQRLVPGCDKVTGKALMLDEIINYVRSLQNQVEFLSTKLSSVNLLLNDFGMDLDAFTLTPDQGLSNYTPSVSHMHQSTTASVLLQEQRSDENEFIQESGSLMWEVEQERQNFVNQSRLISNTSCSFH